MSATPEAARRLYFFWDYDIDEAELQRIIRAGGPQEKAWAISRILEYATWDDIWRYLTPDDIRASLDRLWFRRPQDRELWTYALELWGRGA
jgi:hypothetical protein